MNGNLDIVVRHVPDALSVPSKAVFTRNGKPVVYVAGGQEYRPVEIEVIARNPDEVAVRGVTAGMSVCLAEPEQKKGAQSQ
jgi:multidrug efflux pump subunit AcrA (membrane-fusion protein)